MNGASVVRVVVLVLGTLAVVFGAAVELLVVVVLEVFASYVDVFGADDE